MFHTASFQNSFSYRMAVLQFVLLSVSIFLVTGIEYIVVPDKSASSPCNNSCSLMYYARHPKRFFYEDDTTFEFRSGNHTLMDATVVFFANISNLTLRGNSSNTIQARIICIGQSPGGFSFLNIKTLKIENLSFIKCSNRSRFFNVSVALEIVDAQDLTMRNIKIQETAGLGLTIDNIRGNSHISNTTIESSYSIDKSSVTPNSSGGNLALYCVDKYRNTAEESAIQKHQLQISHSHFLNGSNWYGEKASCSGIFIHVYCQKNLNIVFDHVVVTSNKANKGGNIQIQYIGLSYLWTVTISILNSEISNGHANVGGGLYMTAITSVSESTNNNDTRHQENLLTIKNTTFKNNTAHFLGAGIYLRQHQKYFAAVGKSVLYNCTFQNNYLSILSNDALDHGGVAVHIISYILPEYMQHKTIFFKIKFSRCIFLENNVTVKAAGTINSPRTAALYIEHAHWVAISGCRFIRNSCTGIVAIDSYLLLHGRNTIQGNTGTKGGGMLFCASSMMYLYNGTQLIISNNSASQYGGGIYVEDGCSQSSLYCFFQVEHVNITTNNQTQIQLSNNTANLAGTAIYGGRIDSCNLFAEWDNFSIDTSSVFDDLFRIHHQPNDLSPISSDPISVVFCTINETLKDCPQTYTQHTLPGIEFNVPVVILGQHFGTVAGIVNAHPYNGSFHLDKRYYSQYIQIEKNQSSYLNYSVSSTENTTVTLLIVAEDFYSGYPTYRYKPSFIHVNIEKCPRGFIEEGKKCKFILRNVESNITANSATITRKWPWWIGYKPKFSNTYDIINHPFCPLGYCKNNKVHIQTTNKSFNQDAQCAQMRSGLLCGRCRTNYSLGFGTQHCLYCNVTLTLSIIRVVGLIVVCAVAGILLVVLLTVLNLTVAEGTLNGLIFYANIIQVNADIFFPPDTALWTTFIAWLNLDFGISTCFYDGMDAYIKTWLQFLFPLYIWLISGAIVYFSWKSTKIARLTGRNAVKVLATLFLLSFGKLIRTIIAAVSYTNVVSHDGHINISVWLPDASVHYLHKKHIILFGFAVLAAVISLFYILLLTSIQCLRRTPNKRMCGWVQKLKPLLDAYTGPYKDKYHFWTGLLLLVRVFLFISFAFNLTVGPTLNFALIIAVSTLLLTTIQTGIYRNQVLGLLESSMYVNLILFSTIMMLLIESHTTYKTIAAHIFGSWTALVFLGIVAYHAHKQFFGNPNCARGHLGVWYQESGGRSNVRGARVIQPLIIGKNNSSDSEESEGEHESQSSSWGAPHFREPLIESM